MKSFSDNTVSKEQIEQVRSEIGNTQTALDAKQTASITKLRKWFWGLAAFNLIVSTIVLLIALYKN